MLSDVALNRGRLRRPAATCQRQLTARLSLGVFSLLSK
jgi:hypothetical protein